MGTSKRLAHLYDAQMDDRITAQIMSAGEPSTLLPDEELELDRLALTRPPRPIEARAWVRYGAHPLRVKVRIVAWTSRAVAVKWDAPNGEHRAWVWASAVETP